jgi:phosphoribosylamine--glycine ligase
MKVLVVGSGGREHTLVWKLSQSSRVDKIFCAPGNAGIAQQAKCIDIKVDDIEGLLNFARYEGIDMTVVGPEDPLTKGIVDAFEKEGQLVFGTNKKASQFEGSKVFAKDFMLKYGIPTAEYKTFTTLPDAEEYVRLKGAPLVIKADGLAAGKGVLICNTVDEAVDALRLVIREKKFGAAGNKVIVEQCLVGEEASFMVLIDGKNIVKLASSQDHKRIFDNDEGPNTGGMGAYSPAPVVTDELEQEIMDTVMAPFMKGLVKEQIDFRGVLYVGIMVCDGKPYVLEYNCRFGDPEAQPILMRLETDLYDVMKATAEGRLDEMELKWKDASSMCVVLASGGYPESYEKGKVISGLDSFKGRNDLFVFHAGTGSNAKGDIITSGGRVLGVTALGSDIKAAKANAYDAVSKVSFDGMQYRKDIGDRAINRP